MCHVGTDNQTFDQCEDLKKGQIFIREINTPYATSETMKYIPKVLMTGDNFQAGLMGFVDLQILRNLPKESTTEGDEAFCREIGVYGKAGLFEDR